MIYKFVSIVIVLNIVYEIVEIILPSKKMKNAIKSFILIMMFYVICKTLFN